MSAVCVTYRAAAMNLNVHLLNNEIFLNTATFYISLRAQIYPASLFLKIAAYNMRTAVSINLMQEKCSCSKSAS